MKKETWALFRNIPNNEEGMEFMRMFKKYKNPNVCGKFYRKYRKPMIGNYSYWGNVKSTNAMEFSLYVKTNQNEITYWKNESDENYKNRCDWRNLYYSLHEMSIIQFICYKFKTWRK
jgi:hypothetical protein